MDLVHVGLDKIRERRTLLVLEAGEKPRPSHKFQIGETVMLRPAISRNVPGGPTR